MPDLDFRIVDIKPWIDRAQRDPMAYVERQAVEVVLTAIGSATRDFWREWGSSQPDASAIAGALESLRSQSRTG